MYFVVIDVKGQLGVHTSPQNSGQQSHRPNTSESLLLDPPFFLLFPQTTVDFSSPLTPRQAYDTAIHAFPSFYLLRIYLHHVFTFISISILRPFP
jgi:hypothetical protein